MKYLILSIFLINLFSCDKKAKDNNSKLTLIEDGACYMEKKRAELDYKNGLLKYVVYDMSSDVITDQKISIQLNKYQIEYVNNIENCTDESNCYGEYMTSIINEKFGDTFLDSIINSCKKMSESKYEKTTKRD